MARATGGSADDLRKEYNAAQNAFNKERTPVNRMRYAWLSVLLGPGAGDDSRLQGLLEPLLAKNGGLAANHPCDRSPTYGADRRTHAPGARRTEARRRPAAKAGRAGRQSKTVARSRATEKLSDGSRNPSVDDDPDLLN